MNVSRTCLNAVMRHVDCGRWQGQAYRLCKNLSATQHRQHGTQSGARLQYPRLERRPDRPWTTIKEIHEYAKHLENGQKDTRTITVTGRIISKRESSAKLVFYDLVQDGESIQVMASAGRWEGGSSFAEANQVLSRGDVVEFTGVAGKTNKGQISMIATKDMRVLAPCLHNIPRTGLKDPEKRFRQRHLDMLVNPKVTEILRTRSQIISYIRKFFDERGFVEVETPVLSPNAGGANARPFLTHANALDCEMQLRIAPELYLKQLVIGGMDRVYEIGKQFRNEGIDADHNPEFTTCEFYQAYGNLETLFDDTETLLRGLVQKVTGSSSIEIDDFGFISFERPFARINVLDTLESKLNVSLTEILKDNKEENLNALINVASKAEVAISGPPTIPRILDKLISNMIEPECVQPTFLYNHPLALSPLAKNGTDEKGREIAARFELFVARREIVNAYEELNDPKEQRRRFELQAYERQLGDLEVPEPDTAFCDALEFGLPPTAGWGMGIDRVVQLLTNASHIREVLAFPTMRRLPTTNKPNEQQ